MLVIDGSDTKWIFSIFRIFLHRSSLSDGGERSGELSEGKVRVTKRKILHPLTGEEDWKGNKTSREREETPQCLLVFLNFFLTWSAQVESFTVYLIGFCFLWSTSMSVVLCFTLYKSFNILNTSCFEEFGSMVNCHLYSEDNRNIYIHTIHLRSHKMTMTFLICFLFVLVPYL